MRWPIIAVIVGALVAGCAPAGTGQAEPGSVTTNSARPEPNISSPAVIDSADALKFVLEQAGISDVHPVKGTNGAIGAWASVPVIKKCPVYTEVRNGDSYSVTHLRKTDGAIVPLNLEGYTISPTAADMANWAANNTMLALSCAGNTAPEAKDWPTEAPAA